VTIARFARWAGLGAVALVAAAAACRDQSPGACLDPDGRPYDFHAPADTDIIFHWPAASMPLRVYAESASGVPQSTDLGAELWTRAVRCGELSFNRIADSLAADIVVRSPGAMPPAPPAAVRAAADSVGACTGRTDFDTLNGGVVRPIRVYVVANSSVADTAAVAGCYRFTVAHELGHALGLLSHSPTPGDLMHASPYRRLATANDRITVQTLYRTAPTLPLAP
jgi:hypothetical protein